MFSKQVPASAAYHDSGTQAQGGCDENITLADLEVFLTGKSAYDQVEAYKAGSYDTSWGKISYKNVHVRIPGPLITHLRR